MKLDFSADLRLPNGAVWQQIDCVVDCTIDWQDGEPVLSVDDVLIDVSSYREPINYVSTFCEAASPLMAQTGHEITAMAEADDDLLSQVLTSYGISYVVASGKWRAA